MQPCCIAHWAALDNGTYLSAKGWAAQFREMGSKAFFRDIGQPFIRNYRPTERGAIVVLGANFPESVELANRLKDYYESHDHKNVIAAVYGLVRRLDFDEHLQDWFMLRVLKLRGVDHRADVQRALSQGLQIWQTSKGTGQCSSCADRASLLLQAP